MQIILLGYMGSGKSSVGKKLAKKLNVDFIDLDSYIEEREGCSIAALFAEKGEIYFRKVEHQALEELVKSKTKYVLAVGGGTPCYANNIELINKVDQSVYLKTSIAELYKRLVKNKQKRPLIKDIADDKLQEFIAKHLFERSGFYEQAKLTVLTDGKKLAAIADQIR